MNPSPTHPTPPARRIGIAIELDYPVPWHQGCYQGILHYAEANDWLCVVDPYLVGMVGRDGVADYDGVVGRIDAQAAEAARAHGIPAVNHWNNSPAIDLPSVRVDCNAAARLVSEHLITCGYRRFGHLGMAQDTTRESDLDILTQAVTSKGFAPPEVLICSRDFEASRENIMQFREDLARWLAKLTPPVGVFTGDTAAARYLAQMCIERGLAVPEDVGIADRSDSPGVSAVTTPTLTGIEHDYYRVGYEAAALLDELMQGKAAAPLHKLVAPIRLIQRDATDVFVCDAPLVKEAMRYIAEHCREQLKIEDVVEALHTSERTLRRKFDEVLGRSISDEIARLRVERIKVLLVETDKTLVTIAEEFGFSSAGQFTRFFSRGAGMNPSVYRKKFGEQDEG